MKINHIIKELFHKKQYFPLFVFVAFLSNETFHSLGFLKPDSEQQENFTFG